MPTGRGSWPGLLQGTPKSFFPEEKCVRSCCHTKAPSFSGQDTRPYPMTPPGLQGPPHAHHCPWRTLSVTWPCQLQLLPQWTPSLAGSLLYSTFLASCCTPIPRSKATLSSFTHLCLFLLFSSWSHHQAITEGPRGQKSSPSNLSPASPRPSTGSYWADSRPCPPGTGTPQPLPSL